MTAEALFERHGERLTRRLERLVGSREAAEDLSQEAFLRFWRRAPADLSPEQGAAWLQRTASNLAVDELRRRPDHEPAPLDDLDLAAMAGNQAEAAAVREALGALSAHQRLLVLLRFEAGLRYAEIGDLLEISAEAARKRVDRARAAFVAAFHGALPRLRPVVLLATCEDPFPYREWLEAAGAAVRAVRPEALEGQLALADALVLGGSVTDLDPSIYDERPRVELIRPDRARDLRELSLVRAALGAGLPFLGICRGAQLLNIALGGNLYQDIESDGAAGRSHWRTEHRIATAPGSAARRILGRTAEVSSEHHQAVRRLGAGLRPTSVSGDRIVESFELGDRRDRDPDPGERGGRRAPAAGSPLTLGLQWHPEHPESDGAGRRLAAALVDAAERRERVRR